MELIAQNIYSGFQIATYYNFSVVAALPPAFAETGSICIERGSAVGTKIICGFEKRYIAV